LYFIILKNRNTSIQKIQPSPPAHYVAVSPKEWARLAAVAADHAKYFDNMSVSIKPLETYTIMFNITRSEL